MLQHGRDCPKVLHDASKTGYEHGPDDDRPYDSDGVQYCGRCHYWMGCPVENIKVTHESC